jgi:5-methylcytosine-specific restriction endonuclease McrA
MSPSSDRQRTPSGTFTGGTRQAAQRAGRTKHQGALCKRGHDGLRWTASGNCVECTKASRKPEAAEINRARVKRWRSDHPLRAKAAKANWAAKRRSLEGCYKAEDIEAKRKAQRDRCAYCKRTLGKRYHVDHIRPQARGGSNTSRNLQLTCPSCNMRKHAKEPEVFARELGMLI